MLGRVPIGALIPAWIVGYIVVLGIGAGIAPFIKNRKVLFGLFVINWFQ